MNKTNPTINTPWNRRQPVGEINTQPSQTIPDQTMSIPEILRRFASGLPLQGNKNPIYDGEDDVLEGINPLTLDISEIHELRENMEAELADIEKPKKGLLNPHQVHNYQYQDQQILEPRLNHP